MLGRFYVAWLIQFLLKKFVKQKVDCNNKDKETNTDNLARWNAACLSPNKIYMIW